MAKYCFENLYTVRPHKKNPSVGLTKTVVNFHTTIAKNFIFKNNRVGNLRDLRPPLQRSVNQTNTEYFFTASLIVLKSYIICRS